MKILSTLNPTISTLKQAQKNNLAQIFVPKKEINNKNLNNDSFTYSTNPINFTGKKEDKTKKYEDVVKTLTLFSNNAEKSFEKQYKEDGFFAKSVDAISVLWLSQNRSKVVKQDLDTYNKHIEELNQSIKKGNFEQKFEEIFKVKYEQENIDKFNEANDRLILASTTKYMSDTVNEKLKNDLKIAKDLNGELKDHVTKTFIPMAPTGSIPYIYTKTPEKTVFENMEKAITDAVGGKDALSGMLESQNLKADATQKDKYRAYYNIAKFLTDTSKMTAEKCCKGKTQKELKKDYDEAYLKAFGKKNDIQKRVDNYNRSQQIGSSMLQCGVENPVRLALLGLFKLTNPLATIPLSVALGYGLDLLENATDKVKENDFLKNSTKELMEETTQSYVDYAIKTGMEMMLPNFKTGNEIINTILSTARRTTVTVTTNMVSEYMSSGKWDNTQIAPRAFVSVVFGRMSAKGDIGKNLLSMTRGGVKDALLYDNSEKNSVKQFINSLQKELQKEYMKNPELYSSMKAIAINNPKAFEEMIVDLLQEHVDKAAEESKK